MKILFVASLHHPEQWQAAVDQTPPGETPPLFPPSVSQHFWEKALRKRGYELAIFYRNLSASGQVKAHHHRQGITPGKVIAALSQRIPPEANLEYRRRNQRLIEQAQTFQPDVLWLVGDNTVIYPDTLAHIKKATGCKIIYASGTSPIVFSRPIEQRGAALYDLVLVNDFYHGVQWLELGAARMECLPLSAADPDFHRPYALTSKELSAYTCDVAFVGTLIPAHLYSRRVEALTALTGFDLGLWSVHEVPPELRPFLRGAALGETMLRMLSTAKLTVNTHGNFMRYGGNMRLFEAAGVGTLQLVEDLPGIHQWFTPGENILIYQDAADLREKVAYYLRHDAERQAMAQRARDHVYAHHTYDHRVQRLEQLLEKLF